VFRGLGLATMKALQKAFSEVLSRYDLVRPGDRVLVALSGGADSVALLLLFLGVAVELRLTIQAAHLDHAIRAESGRDADFVDRFCRKLGVSLSAERVDVPALSAEARTGIEETAREARQKFLLRIAAAQDCPTIALGHHRGDQAETFLHRLVRGSGSSGLAGMALRSGAFIRPLLPFSRQEILDFLGERGRSWVEDSSNSDPTYTRNRIRHQLLPLLGSFNPRIEEHLARLSGRIALEEDFWEKEAALRLEELGRPGEGGLRLDRKGLLALHPALRARVLRAALSRVRGNLLGISAAHIDAVEGLLASASQAEAHLPGAWVGRRYGTLWLRSAAPSTPASFCLTLSGPGTYRLPGAGDLRIGLTADAGEESRDVVEFDPAQVLFPLRIRTFRPGDRFRPSGMAGSKKLKDFFIDAKVDREARQTQLLLEGEEILWVVGLRRCEGRRPATGEGPVLRAVLANL
jgi:tRNA(Ile)-lysidine synthase